MHSLKKNLLFVLALLVAAAIPSFAFAAAGVTAIPQTNLDASVHGADAQFVNGSILTKALDALRALPAEEHFGNDAQMRMSADGTQFEVRSLSHAIEIKVDGVPRIVSNSASVSQAAVVMTLGKLRSIDKAFSYFRAHAPTPVTDRGMEKYDVLVYPIVKGRDTGRYFVGLMHHHPAGIKNTRAGCIDSFGGYSGGFIVDPIDWAVTQQSCK